MKKGYRYFFRNGIVVGALIMLSLNFSCVRYKNLNWFTEAKEAAKLQIDKAQRRPYKLREGDMIDIKINSINRESVESFKSTYSFSQVTPSAIFINSYVLNDSGSIHLPMVGRLVITGMTIHEATKYIKKELDKYYKYITVDLKLMNFNISVLGEVENPKSMTVYNSHIDVFQAIGRAGGLTPYAKLKNIRIVRTTRDGNHIHYIDLRDPDTITNENFYLQPDDVIYVESNRAKALSVNSRSINVLLSTLTFLIVSLNTFLQ